MPQTAKRTSADETLANDAINATAAITQNVDAAESKSSFSSVAEKNAKPSAQAAPIAAVPHLSATDDDETWVVDAQAGAVGATWKHRVPALLMILFFTREY